MGNKQKLFENLGSLGMLLVLGGLIAAAILPWWTDSSGCSQAWFTEKCSGGTSPSPPSSPRQGEEAIIYNASYALIICAGGILLILMIVFLLYVFGSRNTRCVPGHALVSLVIVAAVVTFAVGLPAALKSPPDPFFTNSAGTPAIGWYIALAASVLQAIVFVLLFCAFR